MEGDDEKIETGPGNGIAKTSRRQPAHQGRADQAAMAGDVN
jgi:hypothetical protein